MTVTIVILTLAWLSYLMWEAQNLHKARSKLFHVIHVNGTRGKSTVSRLIDAGLRAGGIQTFCKTTGTDPMTIDVSGSEELIYRRGRANIKEQIRILKRAASQEAQVLVVECMAVQPELQHTAQHDILKADIGVITNVRRDHTDVMGNSMAQICDALSNTIPQRGILFTAEAQYLSRLTKNAQVCACQVVPVTPDGTEPDFDFPDNIALALKVCEHLGVERETALAGMAHYKRDPYALSVYQLGNTLFINGLSINDVQSTCLVWASLHAKLKLQSRELILLVHNRADRGSRTQDMLKVCLALHPTQVWLTGAARGYMRRGLARKAPDIQVRELSGPEALVTENLTANQVIFAIGNIAYGGRELIAWVKKEGTPFVS